MVSDTATLAVLDRLRPAGLWLLWLGFILYAFLLAPPDQPDTLGLIQRLVQGDVAGINPLIVALFNLMGVWPAIYASVLLIDGRGQRWPAWPFVLGSFAVGAFALLPYLALRQPNPQFVGAKGGWLTWWDSRLNGSLLALVTLGLLTYGFSQGNWADFVEAWRTSRFIHVMSLDFCCLTLLFPLILRDDLRRRSLHQPWLLGGISLLPLVGPVLYLALRPPLLRPAD
ncbi:MAG: DUF2834 domain-containing protein [Gloeomargaritaceae cyanobacterium C42_A2020_066]|nr:DUF2834 domain-containing protein [Gloeomargaritaceae cyanobacterium C42_A2020_066]